MAAFKAITTRGVMWIRSIAPGALGNGAESSTTTGNIVQASSSSSVLRMNNASLATIQGIAAGSDGQRLTIISVGAGQVDIANQNASAANADKIINPVTGTISLAPGSGKAELIYDATTARWRVTVHDQGAWITPTFAAGDYTGNNSMTWTVASGDVTTMAYWLHGRTLTVAMEIATTTVGGTPSTLLQRTIPGGFTATKQMREIVHVLDNNTAKTGQMSVGAGATVIAFRVDEGFSNSWAASTDLTSVRGVLSFEVD